MTSPAHRGPHWVSPARWPWALLAYFAVGSIVGIAPLQQAALALWGSVRQGNFIPVNFGLPLAAAIIAALFPRWWTVCLGGPLLALGFNIGRLYGYAPSPGMWSTGLLARVANPIVVLSGFGCVLVGLAVVGALLTVRRVGTPPPEGLCPGCGYPVEGLPEARCPECGASLPLSGTIRPAT